MTHFSVEMTHERKAVYIMGPLGLKVYLFMLGCANINNETWTDACW